MANTTVESRIAASSDDAEEKISTGGVSRSSTDLELITDGTDDQLVGLRFIGLDIPPDAVILAHAFSGHSRYSTFEKGFLTVAQDFQKPILYLQGDNHAWQLDNPYVDTPNITRVVLDRTGPNSPLLVTVEDDPDDPFSSDHDFDGLFL